MSDSGPCCQSGYRSGMMIDFECSSILCQVLQAHISRNEMFLNSSCCFHSHFLISRVLLFKNNCFRLVLKKITNPRAALIYHFVNKSW